MFLNLLYPLAVRVGPAAVQATVRFTTSAVQKVLNAPLSLGSLVFLVAFSALVYVAAISLRCCFVTAVRCRALIHALFTTSDTLGPALVPPNALVAFVSDAFAEQDEKLSSAMKGIVDAVLQVTVFGHEASARTYFGKLLALAANTPHQNLSQKVISLSLFPFRHSFDFPARCRTAVVCRLCPQFSLCILPTVVHYPQLPITLLLSSFLFLLRFIHCRLLRLYALLFAASRSPSSPHLSLSLSLSLLSHRLTLS